MTTQLLIFDAVFEKDPHLNSIEHTFKGPEFH